MKIEDNTNYHTIGGKHYPIPDKKSDHMEVIGYYEHDTGYREIVSEKDYQRVYREYLKGLEKRE